MPRYTRADIGKSVPPHIDQSWMTHEELPSGETQPCPMCGTQDDRDPSKNRIGSGKIRHDFINRFPKKLNGYTIKPGVAVVEYLCEVCEGTGEVWINDKTGEREPA